MLKPKHVSSYTNAINEVVTDFIGKVAWLRTTKGNGVMVHDVAGELYKFAFEGTTISFKMYLLSDFPVLFYAKKGVLETFSLNV